MREKIYKIIEPRNENRCSKVYDSLRIMSARPISNFFCNERIMLYAIVLNTIIMFLGGFWPQSILFTFADAFFTFLFLCEAFAKISRYGWNNYWRSGWNQFDFIVLIIALPSLVSPFIEQIVATNTVLALRSMRLFKSFRMLHFIPNIQKLLHGIRMAVKASLLVFIAFFVCLVIFSILSSAIFGNIAPEYFGNPGISLYSIYRLFSVEGWYELPDAIAKNSTPLWGVFARFYFSVLMFLGGIIGISLINSIFVDAMAEDNNDEVLEKLKNIEEQLKKIKKDES